MTGPMEMLAVLALRPEFADKATEEDAQDIFEVGAEFVPKEALRALAHRYPGVTFRHAIDVRKVCPDILQEVARSNQNLAVLSGLSDLLEVPVVRRMLRDDPQRLKYIPLQDRERLVDTALAEELSVQDPISVLRFAKQYLTRKRLEDIAEQAFVENAKLQGYDQAYWSTYRLDTASGSNGLSHNNLRFFCSPLGQIGQGWNTFMSIERTNIKESNRFYHESSDFLVEAVQFTLDNVTDAQAEEVSRNCVLRWDFTQFVFDIGVLADFRYSNTFRGGCYFYSRKPGRRKAQMSLPTGPVRIPRQTTFSILANFGTYAPALEAPPDSSAEERERRAPSMRITLLGRWS